MRTLRIASATLGGRRCLATSSPALSGGMPPCGTACATPARCGADAGGKVDIAHKAVGSAGATYGYTKKYADNWERIFGSEIGKASEKSSGVESGAGAGEAAA
mmetsp:Transcript_126795/g.355077  ORF Transcript_126795/g.355077 Transcript_126795/m.355077 type:complete len:103 (+) Transcript_126795:78-386(+)